MSYNGHIVVDADSHIREYQDFDRTFREYVDPVYAAQFDRLSQAVKARQQPGREQVLFMHAQAVLGATPPRRPLGVYDPLDKASDGPADTSVSPIDMACNWDPSIRLRDMDTANIDISVMFPSQADGFCVLRDVGFETALHEAFHRSQSAYCAGANGRLRWLVDCTMRDVPATVAYTKYWAERDQNLVGIFMPRACPDGRLLDNPDLHPIFQVAQDLDLPIMVHGGTLRPPLTPGATELDNAGFLINALYHGWGGMTAISALIGGGVFDLFPRLRVGAFESGAGWMPWLVERLDGAYRPKSGMTPNLKRKPSEVIAEGRVFLSADPGEDYLGLAVDRLGEDIWLLGTDYPHQGSFYPNGVPLITQCPDISESAKVKLLSTNALRFLPRLA